MKLQDLRATIFFLLSLLAILPHIIANLDSDKHALLQFAVSIPHLSKLNWNSALSICNSWIGITCNKDGTRVVAIHLPGVGLTGHIPANSIGKLDALQVLNLRANNLNGNLPSDILSIPSLYSIYLQHNNFSGDIPVSFSSTLGVIDLSFNSFTGQIPPTIKNLPRLSMLNLKFNSLSGSIPNLDVSRLSFLNLSYNMLNGSVPYSLSKFPLSSFVGNSNLCGTPLSSCSSRSPSRKGDNFKKHSNEIIIPIAIGGPCVIILLVLFIYFCYIKKKVNNNTSMVEQKNEKLEDFGNGVQDSEKNELTFFKGCSYNFDLEDLLSASADFLGKGSYGTAYRVSLDEVSMIVVKRLKEVRVVKKEFEQHMDIVGKIKRHPNIVPFLACYYSKDEKLLVCEYVPYGSLSSALYGNGRTRLDWDTRLKVCLGAAKGIAHIHSEGGTKFTHGNIKASNILLTRDLDGCISDFGLSPLMNHTSIKNKAVGYHAPEVIETRKGTQKSDVYSFGVLVLELLTGKSPLPLPGHEDVVNLPRWVRAVVKEEWTAEVFDAVLMKYHSIQEEMVHMLQIALLCVAKVPDMRPSMGEVIKMIEQIKHL